MIQIEEVASARFVFRLPSKQRKRANRVTIVVGENAAGKTQLLAGLASSFSDELVEPSIQSLAWTNDEHSIVRSRGEPLVLAPSRVIAQTFSPFSRFPSDDKQPADLMGIFPEVEKRKRAYICLGLHRKSRYVGSSLGKRLLEQSLYRLSEDTGAARAMGELLTFLGFRATLSFRYSFSPVGHRLFKALLAGTLAAELQNITNKALVKFISNEARRSDFKTVSARLEVALEQVAKHSGRSRTISLDIAFDSHSLITEYSTLQALSVLRRCGVAQLKECIVKGHFDNFTIDLADASSGQQHMLCASFGLLTAIRSNSLVLIDEPELSLHPKWQTAYLDNLEGVMKTVRGCHVIVATHSPLLVQRAHELDYDIVHLGQRILKEQTGAPTNHPSVEESLVNDFEAPLESSVYLSDELFRLVTTAERNTSADVRVPIRRRLLELRELYQRKGSDNQSFRLIQKALTLVGAK